MISKFINWNSKVNKYVSKSTLAKTSPGLAWDQIQAWSGASYFGYYHYYLNYFTEERIKTANGSSGLNTAESNPNSSVFKSIKGFQQQAVDTTTSGGTLVDLLNLTNPSVAKTMSCPVVVDNLPIVEGGSHYYKMSGFRLEIENTTNTAPIRFFDSMVVQLNKLDKTAIEEYISNGREFFFEYSFKVADSNSLTANTQKIIRIRFRQGSIHSQTYDTSYSNEPYIVAGNTSIAGVLTINVNYDSVNTGLFLIDKEILKYADSFIRSFWTGLGYSSSYPVGAMPYGGITSSKVATSFSFYMRKSGAATAMNPLEVANVTLTNAFELYVDSGTKYGEDNLTAWNMNKKTGSYFPEVNDYNKSFDGKISLLHSLDLAILDMNFFRNNKNVPFYFFPFCNATDGLSDSVAITDATGAIFNRLNLEAGGFWKFDSKHGIVNNDYDDYALDLKLDEYK